MVNKFTNNNKTKKASTLMVHKFTNNNARVRALLDQWAR
jgi:hypothetical protein